MIIDGKGARLGRLASYSAKKALQGEEIIILNCDKIKITGSKRDIKENFETKRARGGSAQKGPYHIKLSEMIVKRSIRGMLLDYRNGRGREAYKKIKCYVGVPKEFESAKKTNLEEKNSQKEIFVEELVK